MWALACLAAAPVRVLTIRIVIRHATPGRDAVRKRGREVRILARSERQTLTTEVRVTAEHPIALLDAQRRRAVVEAGVVEVAHDIRVDHESAPAEIGPAVENGACATAPVTALLRRGSVAAELTCRRSLVVQSHPAQRGIFTRLQRDAVPAEIRVVAD